ncbi:TIGR03862 family flavoprotein [Hymenobacter cellulosilyticus]|uniref:TIGR03862 family flavoprotein n=1 Tax=Hymenobacter cellulosilyticus TaxID=2932248 RepID=UPI0021D42D8B|nr:TIGR03862 family flavoprotein [Hymenobacter cellulosilyticus]
MAPISTAPFIAVVGGGPAGLLSAQRLAEAGYSVTVFEAQPTVGRKFLVAGHGGFNLTNAEPLPTFTQRYGSRQTEFGRFLDHFTPTDLRQWLSSLGIETFVGTSGRIFPLEAHKPAQVLRAWLQHLQTLGVQLHVRHRWLGFTPERALRLRDESTGQEFRVQPAATVLALGGASWAKTGSDGQWPALLRPWGVETVPFAPSNCGAEVAWSEFFRAKVGRAPLKNIALECGGQTVRGELLLTEYGVEGTPVYALTPPLRAALQASAPANLFLNLKPDLTAEQLQQKMQAPRNGKSLAVYLEKTLRLGPPVPTLLRELAPAEAGTSPAALASLLQRLPIPVTGLRPWTKPFPPPAAWPGRK